MRIFPTKPTRFFGHQDRDTIASSQSNAKSTTATAEDSRSTLRQFSLKLLGLRESLAELQAARESNGLDTRSAAASLRSAGGISESFSFHPPPPRVITGDSVVPDSVGDGSFEVNGVRISVFVGDTMNSILKRVNESDAGAEARFDDQSQQVELVQKTPGSAATISVGNDTSGFLSATRLEDAVVVPGVDEDSTTLAIEEVAGIVDELFTELKKSPDNEVAESMRSELRNSLFGQGNPSKASDSIGETVRVNLHESEFDRDTTPENLVRALSDFVVRSERVLNQQLGTKGRYIDILA